jgi:HSP20 family protein
MLPTILFKRGRHAPTRRMQDELDRMLDHWIAPWPNAGDPATEISAAYPVDIYEDDQKIYVDAEMPGFTATDVEVTLSEGILNISAERVEEEREGEKHLYERRHRKIQRSFSLPSPVEEQSVEAQIIDGVLHLELIKVKESESTRIEVK